MAMTIEDTVVQPMTKKAKITFAVVGGVAFLVMVYGIYYWWSGRNFRALVAMAQEEVNWETLSDQEKKSRFESMKSVRSMEKGLSKDQREQLDNIREEMYQKRDMVNLKTFFAMNQKDQTAALDKEIKRDEDRRKQFEKMRQEFQKKANATGQKGGQNAKGGPGGGGQGKGGAGAQGGGGQGGRGQGGGKSSPEQRNKSASNRLDSSSPEYRLARDEKRKRLDERRQQLGLPANSGRPGGGGGGFGGGGGGGRPGGGGGGGGKR